MKIFTNDEVRQIDRYTIENEGIEPLELIERVAEAVVAEIASRWRPSKQVVVFAGPGNNGADALAVSRLLSLQDFKVSVFLFNIGGKMLTTECAACRDMLADCPGVELHEVTDSFNMPELRENMLIIDGLFGSGFEGRVNQGFAILINHINDSHASIVSIDIPSGLSGDWNPSLRSREVIHATLTIVIQHPRLAFFIPEHEELVGEWKVIDIGLSEKAARKIQPRYYLMEEVEVHQSLRRRPLFCSKADFGHAIIYAGSYGMMGAACLAARGALRSGVGKVTVESPRCGYSVLQTAVPEALYQPNGSDLYIEQIKPLNHYNAIAIGPGIGTSENTVRALEEFLSSNKMPLILDADALNCIARRPALLNAIPMLSILTPHPGEFDRLFGPQQSSEARLRKAAEVAARYKIFIVLKGHYTAFVRPDGKIYFNGSGTPAMATAGCGDVLTGVIASFIAQGYKPEIATLMAVYIHGLAGEMAAEIHGQYGVTAGDVADNLGQAIKAVMEG